MLILTRKPGECLYIGDDIKVTIVEIKGNQIRVGIDAPADLRIYREEIYLQILEENRRAAESSMAHDANLEGMPSSWSGEEKPSGRGLGLGSVRTSSVKTKAKGVSVSVKRRSGKGSDD
jgi:carbon storage regulator